MSAAPPSNANEFQSEILLADTRIQEEYFDVNDNRFQGDRLDKDANKLSNENAGDINSTQRYSSGKYNHSINLLQPSQECINGGLKCPYIEMGCAIVLGDNDKMSTHLRSEIYNHNVLLIDWVKNIERVILSMASNGLQEEQQQKMDKARRSVESIITNPLMTEIKANEYNPMTINKFRKELTNVTSHFCYFAKLIRDLKEINDRQIKQLNEIVDQHDKEISQLKQDFNSQVEGIQEELGVAIEKSKKDDDTIKRLQDKIKEFHSEVTDLDQTGSLSLPSSQLEDLGIDEQDGHTPSISWDINKLSHKIQSSFEIWSKYFHSPSKRFTMRLWVHFNEILVSDQMSVELLVWNHSNNSNIKIHFEGLVMISIKNCSKPSHCKKISKFCYIEEPNYSESFIFQHRDLLKSGVLDDDCITVECVVFND